jgi:hypothetical protein
MDSSPRYPISREIKRGNCRGNMLKTTSWCNACSFLWQIFVHPVGPCWNNPSCNVVRIRSPSVVLDDQMQQHPLLFFYLITDRNLANLASSGTLGHLSLSTPSLKRCDGVMCVTCWDLTASACTCARLRCTLAEVEKTMLSGLGYGRRHLSLYRNYCRMPEVNTSDPYSTSISISVFCVSHGDTVRLWCTMSDMSAK